MMMRIPYALVLVTVASLASPGGATGQGAGLPSSVDLGAFAGLGSGPAPSGAWGLAVEVPVHDRVAVKAEYSRWGAAFAACTAEWPDSYRCTVSGWAVLGGLSVNVPPVGRVQPFGEVLGGRFVRAQFGTTHGSTALGIGLGADIRLLPILALRVGGRYMRPYDDAYADLMEEDLSWRIGWVGLRYRVTW